MIGPVRSVAVHGGGVAGWCAAAAFARALPGVAVSVIEDPGAKPLLTDLIAATLPASAAFHAALGLDEATLVARAGALFRLGTHYTGFGPRPYVHALGDHGAAMGGVPFEHLWFAHGGEPFEAFDPAAALASTGRFAPATAGSDGPGGRFDHGLSLDPPRYRDLLRGLALALGVRALPGPARAEVAGARAALVMAAGDRIEADLIVDTRGGVADAVSPEWESWSRWLPFASVRFAVAAPLSEPPLLDEGEAGPEAVTLVTPQSSRTLKVTLRLGIDTDDGMALPLRPGRRARAWVGNVVAVGEAAIGVDPVEAAPLALLHAQIGRALTLLPGRDMNPVETGHYNREAAQEGDRTRDFLALKYLTCGRPEPLWRDLAATEPPPALARDLALFRERGQLPVHDGELFDRESWLSVLIGQGLRPRRLDPMAAELPKAEVRPHLEAMRAAAARFAASAPPHAVALARARAGTAA